MKNTIVSFLILFILLIFVFIGNKNLMSLCNDSLNLSNDIETSLNNDDWNEALNKAKLLKTIISTDFKTLSIYINHQDIDSLNTEIVKLIDFIKIKNLPDALSCLSTIRCLAEYIGELQQVNLTNIL